MLLITNKPYICLLRQFGAVVALLLVLVSSAYAVENRTALIIGNADYKESPLRNPGNDAHDMAEALQRIGFDVTLAVDVNRREMGKSIREFGRKLRSRGGVGLFYYAGHGMQIDSRNYMIPVDSPMEEEDEVPYESVEVGSVLAKMESAGNALNVIILDACRNNPFPSQFRSSARGLARVEAPIGSLIVYSTSPGSVADDGDGRNGIFTGHLLDQLRTPGLSLSETVRRTRAAVVKSTNRAQVPWESSSLLTDIEFTSPVQGQENPTSEPVALKSAAPEPVAPKTQALVSVPNNKPEEPDSLNLAAAYRSLTVDVTPADARVRIMNIRETYKPGIQLKPDEVYDVYVTHEGFDPWRDNVKLSRKDHRVEVVLSPKAEAYAIVNSSIVESERVAPRTNAPTLRSIRGGSFLMGCSDGDKSCEKYEKPSVKLQVPSFSMGRTEVTVSQFKDFVAATGYRTDAERNSGGFNGCYVFRDKGGISRSTGRWAWDKARSWKDPGYKQSDQHPVTCVSWNDAQAYVQWLTSTTGVEHRLPTEAEWEFAARAGATTRYQTGNDSNALCKAGNGADKTVSPKGSRWSSRLSCSDSHWFSAPVASYSPNSFGLHDMHGNLWEWVADTWTNNHENARRDGSVNLAGDRQQRVLRGGGWDGDGRQQRLSARRLGQVQSRTSMIGFRVVSTK